MSSPQLPNRTRLRSRFLLVRMAIAAGLTIAVILVVRYAFIRQSDKQTTAELQSCANRLRLFATPDRPTLESWPSYLRGMCSGEAVYSRAGSASSTLSPESTQELLRAISAGSPSTVTLGGQDFRILTVVWDSPSGPATVTLLHSLRASQQQIAEFTQLMALLAVIAMGIGFFIVVRLSDTFAKPLGNLVEAVRALEKGDFTYPVAVRSGDELAEVTQAFDQMRSSLLESQKKLLKNERLATIGQMASSISHDLRHPLTAIVANSEFLTENNLSAEQRRNLHEEVRVAVDQMNDLIESLLEFSRGRESPRFLTVNLKELAERVAHSVGSRPEFAAVRIELDSPDRIDCDVDPHKMERAIGNLLINACQAVETTAGARVGISIQKENGIVRVLVADNGPGVSRIVRDTLFQPFVSYGKPNGTGLGLAVVQKICEDHAGAASLQYSEPGKTVFTLTFPYCAETTSPEFAGR